MDINAWLASTAFLTQKENQKAANPPQSHHHPFIEQIKSPYQQQEKEQLCTSIPSLIHSETEKHHHKTSKKQYHVDSDKYRAFNPPKNSGGSTAALSTSSVSSERFERRPRRKTRKDLYDPNSGTRKQRKRKRKLKPKKTGYHRTEKGQAKDRRAAKSGFKLISAFHPTNVRDTRLTLNQPTTVGFFGKGRASSPKSRLGLPDLAFSEMRFLQNLKPFKYKEQATKQSCRQRHGKTSASKEEISSYFNRIRPCLEGQYKETKVTSASSLLPKVNSPVHGSSEQMQQRKRSSTSKLKSPSTNRPRNGFLDAVDHGIVNQLGEVSELSWSQSALPSCSDVAQVPNFTSRDNQGGKQEFSLHVHADQDSFSYQRQGSTKIEPRLFDPQTDAGEHFPIEDRQAPIQHQHFHGGISRSFAERRLLNPYRADIVQSTPRFKDFDMNAKTQSMKEEIDGPNSTVNGHRSAQCWNMIKVEREPNQKSEWDPWITPVSDTPEQIMLSGSYEMADVDRHYPLFINHVEQGRLHKEQFQDYCMQNLSDSAAGMCCIPHSQVCRERKETADYRHFEFQNQDFLHEGNNIFTFMDQKIPSRVLVDVQEISHQAKLSESSDTVPRGFWRPNRLY